MNSQPIRRTTQKARWRRALSRGVTLVEILIVLAIVGMIAGGVAAYAVPKYAEAQVSTAKNNLKALHPVADRYYADHSDSCPTVELLKQKREISGGSDTKDPWGKPYKIDCSGDELVVISFGKDGKENTADDLRIPEVTQE